MEEIKVGEYIRTRSKGIKRVCRIDNNKTVNKYMCKGRNDLEYDEYEIVKTTEVKKHSSNIIDLIEVGDYVNGYEVSFKGNDYKPFVQCDYPVKQGPTNHYLFYEEAIENIVTKEQFNSIKYVIGEWEYEQNNKI